MPRRTQACVGCRLVMASALALVWLGWAAAPAVAAPYSLPDAEMMAPSFTAIAGYSQSSSTLDGRADLPGPGVSFALTLGGSDAGKIGIGDPWPTNPAAGLLWDGGLGHYTSLAAYSGYQMRVTYSSGPAGSGIEVGLFLNTGLTGPSGRPTLDPTNDTWWGGPWVNVPLGATRTLFLDFASAQAANITDNKVPHTGGGLSWPDGGPYAINDRDRNEISNIGFQIADFDGSALGSSIQVAFAQADSDVPEPGTLLLCLMGVGALRRRRPL